MSAEIAFIVNEYQSNDAATGDFLDVQAVVACRGFGGQTRLWISGRDLDAFIADLLAVQQTRSGVAQLIGGWDDAEERLRLRISPAGPAGHLLARIKIATTGPRTDQWQRVETEFVCPPSALSTWLTDLQILVGRRIPGQVSLVGDAEAIA